MASNNGKFIDRSPIICAAGKLFGDNQNVNQCMNIYSIQDKHDTLTRKIDERKIDFRYKQPRLKNIRHCGIYTQIRPAIRPPDKTRFQTLIDDLKETSYDSYWNKQEGKCRDPTGGLPAGIDILQTTFGKKNPNKVNAGELINPPKTHYQVFWDSQLGHEMYKKTHIDYNPSEHKDRNYIKPPYNPDKRFGIRSFQEPRGLGVKCACKWFNTKPVSSASNIQSDYNRRSKFPLGKSLVPFENPIPDILLGQATKKGFVEVKELLKDANNQPNILMRDYKEWLLYLNKMRNYLKKRRNQFGFNFNDFRANLENYDKTKTGYIPLNFFYSICQCNGVNYDHEALEPLFYHIGVIQDGLIDYNRFIELSDINYSLPELIQFEEKETRYYLTSQQAAACDYLTKDNSKKPAAGIATERTDPSPKVPVGGCKADLEHLGSETAASQVVNPSIYTNYGLSHRDLFEPRPPEVIKMIFSNAGFKITEEEFERLWKLGAEHDKTGLVCVDTFRNLL